MRHEKTYAEKLRDPRWQKQRLRILERDNFQCRDCGSTTKELHVHHSLYIWNRDPWDYLDSWLRTVCKDCHELRGTYEHDAATMFRAALASLTVAEIQALCSIMCVEDKAAAALKRVVVVER